MMGKDRGGRPVKVLLSEGSSTSAREAITALGRRGFHLEVCDPDPRCLGRFSRFVRKFHRCPGIGVDPQGYRDFILDLLTSRRFDVLLPIHEQGYLFAAIRDRLRPLVGLALPSFESYALAHSKAGFSMLLAELGLPQPMTRLVSGRADLLAQAEPPIVIKMPIGTASRGVWLAEDATALAAAVEELGRLEGFGEPLLLQEFVPGPIEHAQAVFMEGRLLACHTYRQLIRGLGGGEALKESVDRPGVRADMAKIGAALEWEGGLSVDYVFRDEMTPHYIDCNPRLVEPMSAQLAGLDLAVMLVDVSRGDRPAPIDHGTAGVRTQLALQAILGCADRTGSRAAVLRECWRLIAKRGAYEGAREELTPFAIDPPSVLPTVFAAAWMLADPAAAAGLARTGWGAHLLDARAAAIIRGWKPSPSA